MFKKVYNLGEIPPEQTCCEENTELIGELQYELLSLTTEVSELQKNNHTHESNPEPPPVDPPSDTINVEVIEKHKFHYFIDTDNACAPMQGKPKMLTDNIKPPMIAGQQFLCYASLVFSCVDTPNTPTIIANGGDKYFRIAVGEHKGRFIRQNKSKKL